MSKYPPDLTFISAPSSSKKSNKEQESKQEQETVKKKKPPNPNASKLELKKEQLLKDRMQHVTNLTNKHDDLDRILDEVKAMEEICSTLKCKVKIKDFSITCDYCKARFCTTHYLPEVHGCGEAVKKDYKQKYLHPGPEKLPKHKKEQCENKFHMKLKQMQDSRKKVNKANTGGSETKKNAKKK